MYGVIKPDVYYLCQQDRTTELNERIFDRIQPNIVPQMVFSPRPVPTKYSIMPIMDPVVESSVPIKQQKTYNTQKNFLPGAGYNGGEGGKGPWSGYASKVNDESKLHNQFFALSKCQQGSYVPKLNSDMYVSKIPMKPDANQTHPLLFNNEQIRYNTTTNECLPVTQQMFNNNTRPGTLSTV